MSFVRDETSSLCSVIKASLLSALVFPKSMKKQGPLTHETADHSRQHSGKTDIHDMISSTEKNHVFLGKRPKKKTTGSASGPSKHP